MLDVLSIYRFVGTVSTIVFVNYLCSGMCFLIRSWRAKKMESCLQRNGILTTGHITMHYFNSCDLPGMVVYRYEYEGKSYERNQIVHNSDDR
ncbi:hypothetical protein ccbrp13_56910 [Ktedonobacteria bacterium brp13]|nr:hypothetical protein ccbrp13_56910 [Ktedonobacteria bacterium brp13]